MPEDSLEDERRRYPAEFKAIGDINTEDVRVSFIGTIVDKGGNTVIVDDGTGKMEIEFDPSEDLDNFEDEDKVRIIGRPQEDGLNGEAIQDFSDFDLELYEEAKEKIREIESSL